MSIAPLFFALLMWFIGTAAVVWLDSRPQHTFATSFRLSGLVALAATGAVWFTVGEQDAHGAYVGFGAAILIWGWHEMGFLMGFVAGSRRDPLPEGVTGWPRFRMAAATVMHHEIALALTALALFAITWGQSNQSAPLTFLLLFLLRLSAKFNLFLGVPNLSDEVFPAHLAYLKSYFRKRRMNALYPFSLIGTGAIAAWAWIAAESAPFGGEAAVTATLLFGLAALGIIEHLFLVLPLRDAKLWTWASSEAASSITTATTAAKTAITD